MAPQEENEQAVHAPSSSSDQKTISTILVIVAMQTEALPLVKRFCLSEDPAPPFPKGVPWVRYHGVFKDLQINILWPGKDSFLGVDSVGTVSASLVTYASILALKPDLVINAGTAGGFKLLLMAKGACIGDVFLASNVAFHDRRIPIPRSSIVRVREASISLNILKVKTIWLVFDLYGIGTRKAFCPQNVLMKLNLKAGWGAKWSIIPDRHQQQEEGRALQAGWGANADQLQLLLNSFKEVEHNSGSAPAAMHRYSLITRHREQLGGIMKMDHDMFHGTCILSQAGKLSTGDSLDMSPQDEAAILANDAAIKDMEGAAVAYVADLLSVPAIFIKAVTDVVDGNKPTAEEFLQNLAAVTAALDQAVTQVVDFINGKQASHGQGLIRTLDLTHARCGGTQIMTVMTMIDDDDATSACRPYIAAA
ncbi:hypothetical protein ACLOJK_000788 [Asimina triloba]